MQHSKHPRGRPPRKKHASNIQHLRKKSIHSIHSPEFESDTEEDMGDIMRWDPHAGLKPLQLDGAVSEQKLKARGHICIFIPKFHCESNPIEMVSFFSLFMLCSCYSVLGLVQASVPWNLQSQIRGCKESGTAMPCQMSVLSKWSTDFSINHGGLWMYIVRGLQERWQSGLCANRSHTEGLGSAQWCLSMQC